MADAAEKTAEAQENSLASFDQITKLGVSSSSSDKDTSSVSTLSSGTISTSVDVNISEADKKLKDFFKWVKASFNTFFEPLKKAWNSHGTSLLESIKTSFNEIMVLAGAVGDSFASVWNNGSGERTFSLIFEIIQNIVDTVGLLAEGLKKAWQQNNVGDSIVQHIFNNFNDMLETIRNITGTTKEWVEKLDFSNLLESINNLLDALEPLNKNIGDGLEWFWKNVLLPMAGWTIEDAIPAFLDLLSGAIKVLNAVIDALKPLAEWLFDNFLKPIAEWTGGVIVTVLETLADALEGISSWISENQTAFQIMTGVVVAFFAVWEATTIAEWIINAGGLIGILGKLKSAINAVTIAKIADKIESIKIIGLYAKDFVVSIGTYGRVHMHSFQKERRRRGHYAVRRIVFFGQTVQAYREAPLSGKAYRGRYLQTARHYQRK